MKPTAAYLRGQRTWWPKTEDMSDGDLWRAHDHFESRDDDYAQGALRAIRAEIDHRDCYY